MFYQLDDYFTNKGYELLHTAGFLTIAGEPDWFEDEEYEEGDEDSDDEYDSDEEDGDTYDVVRGLCGLCHWVDDRVLLAASHTRTIPRDGRFCLVFGSICGCGAAWHIQIGRLTGSAINQPIINAIQNPAACMPAGGPGAGVQ